MCRLIEQCGEEGMKDVLDEILADAYSLARHNWGNFVVQSIIENTSPVFRQALLWELLPNLVTLAMHRNGSRVAQRLFDFCDIAQQRSAMEALIKGTETCSLADVACCHYGSYVIAQLASYQQTHREAHEIARTLGGHLPRLQSSEHAQEVLEAFGFPRDTSAHTA